MEEKKKIKEEKEKKDAYYGFALVDEFKEKIGAI